MEEGFVMDDWGYSTMREAPTSDETVRGEPAPAVTLDVAWHRAKAAMPTKGKPILSLQQMPTGSEMGRYCALAIGIGVHVYATTEVEALTVLAERLEGDVMTTADKLAALREAATPGPWRWEASGFSDLVYFGSTHPDAPNSAASTEADAALIVALVNALPALVELVRAAEAYTRDSYPPDSKYDLMRWDALCAALAALDGAL
jgi:hypothetical protein